jgi:hypothetical protein
MRHCGLYGAAKRPFVARMAHNRAMMMSTAAASPSTPAAELTTVKLGTLSFRYSLPWYKTLLGRFNRDNCAATTGGLLYDTVRRHIRTPEWSQGKRKFVTLCVSDGCSTIACDRPAVDPDEYFAVYKSDDDFHAWFTLSMLHVWLLMVRLRRDALKLPSPSVSRDASVVQDTSTAAAQSSATPSSADRQYFSEDALALSNAFFAAFWIDVERQLAAHDLANAMILSKYLKIYTQIYYGSVIAYDEALVQNDASLADALWR